MNVFNFNRKYRNTLPTKLYKEKKHVLLLGNFNINLLNHNDHQPTNDFLDSH